MAALRAGIKTVLIPAENEPDLDEIDQTVRNDLNFITTDNIDEILDVTLDFSTASKKDALPEVSQVIAEKRARTRTGANIKH